MPIFTSAFKSVPMNMKFMSTCSWYLSMLIFYVHVYVCTYVYFYVDVYVHVFVSSAVNVYVLVMFMSDVGRTGC